jgi:hypothetical protein
LKKWEDAAKAFSAAKYHPDNTLQLERAAAGKKWQNAVRARLAAEAGGGGGVPPAPLHRPQLHPAGGAGAADGGAPLAGEADGANNVPQHKMPGLIAFLNGKIIDGIAIQVKVGIKKQTIRVVFNVPGIDNADKPTFDINVNNFKSLQVRGGDLAQENQKIDELMQHITAFKNQQQGGRRIKYTKKRTTHKKRTRRIRRKHSRRN